MSSVSVYRDKVKLLRFQRSRAKWNETEFKLMIDQLRGEHSVLQYFLVA